MSESQSSDKRIADPSWLVEFISDWLKKWITIFEAERRVIVCLQETDSFHPFIHIRQQAYKIVHHYDTYRRNGQVVNPKILQNVCLLMDFDDIKVGCNFDS